MIKKMSCKQFISNFSITYCVRFVGRFFSETTSCFFPFPFALWYACRVYRTWGTPRPGIFMRPTFQTASEDHRQTSILHRLSIRNNRTVCQAFAFWLFVQIFVAATFKVLLNGDHRAVEFFIRDKYEKRIYYSKNVTNGSSVCIGSQPASSRS